MIVELDEVFINDISDDALELLAGVGHALQGPTMMGGPPFCGGAGI